MSAVLNSSSSQYFSCEASDSHSFSEVEAEQFQGINILALGLERRARETQDEFPIDEVAENGKISARKHGLICFKALFSPLHSAVCFLNASEYFDTYLHPKVASSCGAFPGFSRMLPQLARNRRNRTEIEFHLHTSEVRINATARV